MNFFYTYPFNWLYISTFETYHDSESELILLRDIAKVPLLVIKNTDHSPLSRTCIVQMRKTLHQIISIFMNHSFVWRLLSRKHNPPVLSFKWSNGKTGEQIVCFASLRWRWTMKGSMPGKKNKWDQAPEGMSDVKKTVHVSRTCLQLFVYHIWLILFVYVSLCMCVYIYIWIYMYTHQQQTCRTTKSIFFCKYQQIMLEVCFFF